MGAGLSWSQGQADFVTHPFQAGQGRLDGNGVAFYEAGFEERKQTQVQSLGIGQLSETNHPAEAGHRLGQEVRGHADDALGATAHQRERLVVVAAQYRKVCGRLSDDFTNLGIVAGGFLDADDVGNLAQAQDGLWKEVGTRTSRDIVQDDILVGVGCSCPKVFVEPGLCGFVVIGSDQQVALNGQVVQALEVLAGCMGAVAASAHQQRCEGGCVADNLQDAEFFVGFQARCLGGCAEGYEEVNATGNLTQYVLAQGFFINGSLEEGGYQGGSTAAPGLCFVSRSFLVLGLCLQQFAELIHLGLALLGESECNFRRQYGTPGKTFAGEGLVFQGQAVRRAGEGELVDAGHIADSFGLEGDGQTGCFGKQVSHFFGGATGCIQLLGVVGLRQVGLEGGVNAFDPLAQVGQTLEEQVGANGEVGGMNQGRSGGAEGGFYIGLQVVPTGGSHHHGFEMPGQEGVVFPESIGCAEVDADGVRIQGCIEGTDVVGGDAGVSFFLEDAFHHVSHFSVSAKYDFHVRTMFCASGV